MAAAQVLGLALLAEPPEVDDALDAFALGHSGEVQRTGLLSLGEPPATRHRVDEVVGDLNILTRARQALRVSDVADVEIEARCLQSCGPSSDREPGSDSGPAVLPARWRAEHRRNPLRQR